MNTLISPEQEFEKKMTVKIDRLMTSPPIDVNNVDFSMENPELVRQEMGSTFAYFGRVESEVQRDVATIKALLPRMEPFFKKFVVEGWEPQEVAHGKLFDTLQRKLELQPMPVATEVGKDIIIIGAIGKLAMPVHEIMEVVYLFRGDVNETAVETAYPKMATRLIQLKASAPARVLTEDVKPQEGMHRGIYHPMFKEKWRRLSPRQKLIAKILIVTYWDSVGANTDENREHFAQTNLDLMAGEQSDIEIVAQRLDKMAENLLTLSIEELAELETKGRINEWLMKRAIKYGVFEPGFISRKTAEYLQMLQQHHNLDAAA